MEADDDVTVESIDVSGLTEAINVGRRGAGDLLKHGNAARDHVAVLEIADAQHAIDSFADHVDQPIALAHVKFDAGIFSEEIRQARHHKMTRQSPVNIDAQQSLRFGAAKGGLRLLDVSNQ